MVYVHEFEKLQPQNISHCVEESISQSVSPFGAPSIAKS